MNDAPTMLERLLRAFNDGMEDRCNLFRRHDWEVISYGKRRCILCGVEQWLMMKEYPLAGEPKYHWETLYDPKFL